MTDTRKHRGPHPADHELFASAQWPQLRAAVADLSWLLQRDYALLSSLKLVGDRYQLRERQRIAVRRSACSDKQLAARNDRQVSSLTGRSVAIDGFNLLVTVESALAGGVVLRGQDGCCRDMASMHGTYRRVAETDEALTRIGRYLEASAPLQVVWFLDRPVSNSIRLAKRIDALAADHGWTWTVQVVADPDDELAARREDIVISADAGVLDRCGDWCNAAAAIVDGIPTTRLVDLRSAQP